MKQYHLPITLALWSVFWDTLEIQISWKDQDFAIGEQKAGLVPCFPQCDTFYQKKKKKIQAYKGPGEETVSL